VRDGRGVVAGVVFHTDRGSTYTARHFSGLCERLGVRQSMGRVGSSCFDNAAAEILSRHRFTTRAQGRAVVVAWCLDFCNQRRRHSSAGLQPPEHYEMTSAHQAAA
jgi:transposase InsO family protein